MSPCGSTFELKIVLPERTAVCLPVERLQVLAESGWRGILAHHGPLICLLQPHLLSCGPIDGPAQTIRVAGGILQITDGDVLIMTSDCAIEPS